MTPFGDLVAGPRPGRMRDRRASGMRGPLALPGPLSADHIPRRITTNQRFDAIVRTVVSALKPALSSRRPSVDVMIDHVPFLPDDWSDSGNDNGDDVIPLCSAIDTVSADSSQSAQPSLQLVVFRSPHVNRAQGADELRDLVWTSVLYKLSEIWETSTEELDPR